MTTDALLRILAVAAAVALIAAPYAGQIRAAATAAAEAVRQHSGIIGRLIAASLLIAAAWGKVPMPTLPAVGGGVVAPGLAVEEPSAAMRETVEPIAKQLRGMSISDRMLWAATWSKVALVAAGDVATTEVVFSDTRALRVYTALSLDIAWRRIGGHKPGNEPLRSAVEAAYASAVGDAIVPVDASVRERYVAFCRAVAWAAMPAGG